MRVALTFAIAAIIAAPSFAKPNPEKDAVRQVVAAVKADDLKARFPGAVEDREVLSLRRVAKCEAFNLMSQKGGYWTVVWGCKDGGLLGMEVHFENGKVSQVKTMEVERRPNVGGR